MVMDRPRGRGGIGAGCGGLFCGPGGAVRLSTRCMASKASMVPMTMNNGAGLIMKLLREFLILFWLQGQ